MFITSTFWCPSEINSGPLTPLIIYVMTSCFWQTFTQVLTWLVLHTNYMLLYKPVSEGRMSPVQNVPLDILP